MKRWRTKLFYKHVQDFYPYLYTDICLYKIITLIENIGMVNLWAYVVAYNWTNKYSWNFVIKLVTVNNKHNFLEGGATWHWHAIMRPNFTYTNTKTKHSIHKIFNTQVTNIFLSHINIKLHFYMIRIHKKKSTSLLLNFILHKLLKFVLLSFHFIPFHCIVRNEFM